MTIQLHEEQLMLRDSAKGWLQQFSSVQQFRDMRNKGEVFSPQTWAQMSEMGWCGLLVDEQWGGSELGLVEAGLIAEEIGRSLSVTPLLFTAVVATKAIQWFGSTDQRGEILPEIVRGQMKVSLAVDEYAKHNPIRVGCTGEMVDDDLVLNGSKTFVAEGQSADVFIVSVRTSGSEDDAQGITLLLVRADTEGVEVSPMKTIDSRDFSKIEFTNVKIKQSQILGEIDNGYQPLESILNVARVMLAVEMAGAAEKAFEISMEYLKVRQQFGRTIGSYQALQHRAAKLYTELKLAFSAAYFALEELDQCSESSGINCAIAKAKCGEVALHVANESIQFHGGVGMTDEYDIGLYLKRIRVAQEQLGDYDFLADKIALSSGY